MRMQTTAGHLRASLRLFRGIIQQHNTIPVLGMVRLADGRMTGTDLDMELSVSMPTIGRMKGAAAIDYFAINALAGCVDSDQEVTISEGDRLASVTFNGSEYRMSSCAVADYPDFSAIEGPATETGNLGLVAAMQRVRLAISTEETRYYLNGVALIAGPNGPVLAATDGHRLAIMPLDVMPEGAAGAIIPRAAVHWLCAGKREPERCVFGGVEPGNDKARPHVRFDFAGARLSAKLIDGTFPDIYRVVPRDPKPVFSIDRATMLRALQRMRAFTPGRYRGVKLTGDGSDLTLSLAGTCDTRAAIEKLTLDGKAARAFEAGYNVDYLVSLLSAFRGDRVTFAVDPGGENPLASAPCLITCDDDNLRIVQMPMRV
ncbi:hypothetical protein [Mesorhizobium sp. SP-1A]|uniref:DNA polymerase III subunit beta n=1 Tax=Mesorhizobium sp. SP-1A TaxID=3077840 RepID=UPI0028F6F06F|nr:hypothetical protein [Mesorhizobium sp. SP-1A]